MRGVVALLLGLSLVVLVTRQVRFNVMRSLPYGLYGVSAAPETLVPGDLVFVRTPATVRLMAQLYGWPWGILALLKPVAAVGRQMVCDLGRRLVIDGQDWGPIYPTSHDGQPLPSWLMPGECRQLDADQIFVASPVDGSLDSRYVGPIDRHLISTTAVPWWTWGGSVHAAPH